MFDHCGRDLDLAYSSENIQKHTNKSANKLLKLVWHAAYKTKSSEPFSAVSFLNILAPFIRRLLKNAHMEIDKSDGGVWELWYTCSMLTIFCITNNVKYSTKMQDRVIVRRVTLRIVGAEERQMIKKEYLTPLFC